jgi:hypothetical protein
VFLLDIGRLSPQSLIEPNKEWHQLVSRLHLEDRGVGIEDLVGKARRLPRGEVACDLPTAREKPLPKNGGLVDR